MPDHATACNCSVCRRYGTLWAYDWLGEKITTSGTTAHYMWGDRGIEFHHCPTCGCITWWQGHQPHPDGRTRVAVNLRQADDPAAVAPIPVRHFDGADSWEARPDDGATVSHLWF